ncbi:hypothetical protein BGZ73_008814 [Actinomortierella ambigua]|nr:hypothetical protein BGZ73_008814 [Actinomortierella ambigua]
MSMVNHRRRKAIREFVRLVLSLTPCQDSVIRALRDEFEVHFPRGTMYTDYLAHVRDVAYHPSDDVGHWRTDWFPRRNNTVYRGMDLRPWVSWAICEYTGLHNIAGLTIDCDNLGWFKGYIPRFTALQRIIFEVGCSDQVHEVHDFVQHCIHIHGPRARRMSLELVGAFKDDFATVLGIYALLESPHPYPRTIARSTFASYVLHQDTTDFSNVLAIDGFMDDLGRTRAILPKCRRLESLDANLSIQGSSIFDWLRPRWTGDPLPSPNINTTDPPSPPSPPPVKHIQLHGSPSGVFNALSDAVTCFGSTLETIQLRDPYDANEQPQVYRLAAGLCLPRLRELRITFELNEYSISFQPSSIPKMPALEVLEMYHAFDRYSDIGGLQYSEGYHQIYPRTTWEIFNHMPALKILHLSGRTAAEFHPESLRSTPCLENVTIRIRSSDWTQYWPSSLWTWDWELPFLRELHLGGVVASSFAFRALRHMPVLEHLRLECKTRTPMTVPDYETLLATETTSPTNSFLTGTGAASSTAFSPTPTRRNKAQSIIGRPFGRNIKHVFFGGRLRFTARDWEQLLVHWFPNLEVLDLNFLITRRTRTIFDKARRHPCLRLLSLTTSDDELDDEDDTTDGEFGYNGSSNSNRGGDLIDDDWEPLQNSEDEEVVGGQAGQHDFFACRIDEVLYRVKKVRDPLNKTQIDDAPTLFSLLTVNKAFFALAVRQLYRKVFNMPSLSAKAVEGYIRLVLSISPLNTKALEMLRQHYRVKWPRQQAPYLDYLALLTDARFEPNDARSWKQGPAPLANLDLRTAILWAVCGHRLSEITALSVAASDLRVEPFFLDAHLPKYQALERAEFRVASTTDLKSVQEFLKRFIKANPKAKQLEVALVGAKLSDIDLMRSIARLLNPPRMPKQINILNFVACHTHRKQVDFSHVTNMVLQCYPSLNMKEEHLLKDLLPLCPNLVSFSGNISDPRVRMFGYAVAKPDPTKKWPLLRRVHFCGESLPALVAVDDALHGFAPTLEELYVEIIDNLEFAKDHFSMKRLGAGCHLAKLRHLHVDSLVPNVSVTFDPDAIPDLPVLESLELGSPSDASEEGMQYSEMLHQMYPIMKWPVLELPTLTELILGGRSAAEFNPMSFQHMPCLRTLALGLFYEDWHDYWPKESWTWDWPLPLLQNLKLEGAMTSSFSFTSLRFMPALESLQLISCHEFSVPAYQDLGVLLGGLEGDSELLSNIHINAVKKFELSTEDLDIRKKDWELLLGPWFPSLEELKVSTRSLKDRDVVQRAKRHPRLCKLSIEVSENSNSGIKASVEEGWEKVDVDPDDWQYDESESEWPTLVAGDARLLLRLNGEVYRLAKDIPVF